MERLTIAANLLLFGVLCFAPSTVQGRQMCLSCSYSSLSTTSFLPCLDDPWNWGGGNVRQRCNFNCFIDIRFDMNTEQVNYAFRGCSPDNTVRENKCYELSDVIYCYAACAGEDYCNNWNATDIIATYSTSSSPQLLPFAALICVVSAVVWFVCGKAFQN